MIAWLIETFFAVTVLMVLVLAVRRPVAHFFGAGWAYALWLLPALRIVLPPLHMFGDAFPSLWPAAAPVPVAAAVAVPQVEVAQTLNWEPLLLAAWLAGAAIVIVWQSWSYLSFIRRLGIGSQVHASLAQEIGIIESPEVDGPLAIGLLDRWIVVPADFRTRYTPQEQRLALQHERTHHQREDIFCNMVALGVLALNWFNPIAYIAFRAFRSDQELSCDAAVASRASRDERHDYARALVKSASKPGLIAACPLNHAGQLKQRLKMMKAHRACRLRAVGGSSAVGAILLAGISVTEAPVAATPKPLSIARTALAVEPAAPPEAVKVAVQAPVSTKATSKPKKTALAKAALSKPVDQVQPEKAVLAEATPVDAAEPLPNKEPRIVYVRVDGPPPEARRFASLDPRLAGLRELHLIRREDVRRDQRLLGHVEQELRRIIAERGPLRPGTAIQFSIKEEQEN